MLVVKPLHKHLMSPVDRTISSNPCIRSTQHHRPVYYAWPAGKMTRGVLLTQQNGHLLPQLHLRHVVRCPWVSLHCPVAFFRWMCVGVVLSDNSVMVEVNREKWGSLNVAFKISMTHTQNVKRNWMFQVAGCWRLPTVNCSVLYTPFIKLINKERIWP